MKLIITPKTKNDINKLNVWLAIWTSYAILYVFSAGWLAVTASLKRWGFFCLFFFFCAGRVCQTLSSVSLTTSCFFFLLFTLFLPRGATDLSLCLFFLRGNAVLWTVISFPFLDFLALFVFGPACSLEKLYRLLSNDPFLLVVTFRTLFVKALRAPK